MCAKVFNMQPVTEMTTAMLVHIAENMTGSISRWLDMSVDERARQRKPGMASPDIAMTFSIPMCVIFLREINRRGIETGWEWLIEEFDAAMEEKNVRTSP